MIPILYDSNETTFTSNGLGRLAEATKCEVTEERNGEYELVLEYPVDGPQYSKIQTGRYIKATHDNTLTPQAFQIYQITEPLTGTIEVRAWHISYLLNNIILEPFTAGSCAEAVAKLSTKSINTNPFSFWTDKSVTADFELDVPRSVRSVLGGTQGSLLDVYGKGEYEFDMFTVRLYLNRGADRGVTIRYGKNLAELERELDASNVYNAVVPYWTDGENSVYLTTPVVRTGETAGRIIALDLSDAFEEEPTTVQLTAKAQSYVDGTDNYTLKENLKIDFVQLWQTSEYKNVANLQRVSLCDTVHVIYAKRGINVSAKCIKVVYDTLRERYTEMELGEPRTTLAQQIEKDVIAPALGNIPSKSSIQSAIQHATSLIAGGFGGYIKFNYLSDGTPSELLIMDTPDESTATHIIRFNMNGLGFSDDGGTTYRNAWTIDGQLNADFITTGNLIASIITTGLLQDALGNNYWNLDTGQLVTTAGQIGNFTLDNGVLKYGTDNDDNSPYVEISTNRLVYKPAGWNARMVIDGQKLAFESYDDTNQVWIQNAALQSVFNPDPVDSSKEYPSLMLSLYTPDGPGTTNPYHFNSGEVYAGIAPAGVTRYYAHEVPSTYVNGYFGALQAAFGYPLGIESGGTGVGTAAALAAARVSDILDACTEYEYRTTSTSTSTETVKSYTVHGDGVVFISASIYTNTQNSNGLTQTKIERNGTIVAYDWERFTTNSAQNHATSASVALKVSDGDTIRSAQYSTKAGTKTIMMYVVALGCTLT